MQKLPPDRRKHRCGDAEDKQRLRMHGSEGGAGEKKQVRDKPRLLPAVS